MVVRRVGAGDEGIVRDVLSRFKGHAHSEPEEFLADPRTLLFVALDDDRCVGWLYGYELIRPEGGMTMLIYEVEVAPDARGHGHGSSLIEALLAEARRRGHRRVWVLTDPDNEAAHAFYGSTGAEWSTQSMFTWSLTE